jgi:membrane protease subunit HflC
MRLNLWIAAAVAAVLLFMSSTYVVREGHVGIVLNLGRVVRADVPPGLHFKWPLVETAHVYDKRLQVLDAEPERYLTSEKKDVSVDFFSIGQIEDVRTFYRATGGDESIAVQRLAPIIKDSLRNEMVAKQLDAINRGAGTLGIRIVDIRIKRIDLPPGGEVIEQVYRRMRAQRHQVAAQLRAEGEELSQKIRSEADRDRRVIMAEAERDAQKLRGEGDALATAIYADAYGEDPAFYAFHRSLEAYRKSFADGNAAIVLDEGDPFLEYLHDDQ